MSILFPLKFIKIQSAGGNLNVNVHIIESPHLLNIHISLTTKIVPQIVGNWPMNKCVPFSPFKCHPKKCHSLSNSLAFLSTNLLTFYFPPENLPFGINDAPTPKKAEQNTTKTESI
jgi:hypothetical protein